MSPFEVQHVPKKNFLGFFGKTRWSSKNKLISILSHKVKSYGFVSIRNTAYNRQGCVKKMICLANFRSKIQTVLFINSAFYKLES